MTTATAIEPTILSGGDIIKENAILFCLSTSVPGNRKKVNAKEHIVADMDPDSFHMSKDLIKADEFDAIKQHDASFRDWVRGQSVPSLFRAGVYQLNIRLVQRVEEKKQQYYDTRDVLIDEYMLVYDERCKEAETRLGTLFNENDYPSSDNVRRAFKVRAKYVEITAPDKMSTISEEMYQREQKQAKEDIQAVANHCTLLLRTELQSSVDRMIDRMTPQANGKKKIFRDAFVPKFKAAMQLLEERDITDDPLLRELTQKAAAIVGGDGVDSTFLRDFEDARATVAASFTELKVQIDQAVVDAPSRFITLEED